MSKSNKNIALRDVIDEIYKILDRQPNGIDNVYVNSFCLTINVTKKGIDSSSTIFNNPNIQISEEITFRSNEV